MNPDDVRKALQKTYGANFHEVHHVTTFRGYRTTSTGESQLVIVDILDLGPDARDFRYSCHALTEDGRFATGNPADSIDHALSIVHWDDLDKKADRGEWRHWR